jgi:heat shock 70kDa protein 4
LNGKLAEQSGRDLSVDPAFTIADVNAQRETVIRISRPIMTKPKPAPPKPEPTPASPAPTADANTTPPAADEQATSTPEAEAPAMDVD